MYFDYVHNALVDKLRGKDATYQEMVTQFKLPTSRNTTAAMPSVGILQMLLTALSNEASRLDRRNHTPLVHAILTLPWATMGGDSFARTWTRFVCNLCSVRSEWTLEILSRAVRGLSYRSDWRSLAYVQSSSSQTPTRRMVYARIHTLLRTLLSLIPTLSTQLAPLVRKHFPHKSEGIREHTVYIQNIFAMCEYAVELQRNILEYVIGRCVEIDVEVQIELDDLEDAEADLEDTALETDTDTQSVSLGEQEDSLLDKPLEEESDQDSDEETDDGSVGLDDIDSDDDEEITANHRSVSERERLRQVRELVDKLDAIMVTLFTHLETLDTRYAQISKGLPSFHLTPARAITLRADLFSNIIQIFTRTLLPTFKSRHVQFLLFWFSSLDQDYSDMFLGMLLDKAIYSNGDDNQGDLDSVHDTDEVPIILRIAAASYVASFVSRAKYIATEDVRSVVLNMASFLDAHLDAQSSGAFGNLDSQGPHALFYAICQACLYIFCFRWRDLQTFPDEEETGDEGDDDDEERNGPSARWCQGLDSIKRAIMSRLNPLAHCSSTVVQQFAGVAQVTGFLYCWSIIESNSRAAKRGQSSSAPGTPVRSLSRANSSTSLRKEAASTPISPIASTPPPPVNREIDSFFPFDPYRLRGSTKWIEPLYREWSDVAPDGMVDDDVDEDDDQDSSTSASGSDEEKPQPSASIPMPKQGATSLLAASRSTQHPLAVSTSTDDTDESSVMTQSLEAMSISPQHARF